MLQLRHIAAAVLSLATVAAQAASVQNNSGLASPAVTVTFDEQVLADGTAITSYQGLGFSPSLAYNSQGGAAFPGITGNYAGNNANTASPFNPFVISFGGDLTAAAFGVATNPATSLFEALNNGSVVESFSAATNFNGSGNSFFGFTGITFDAIRVTTGGDGQMLIDNIQMGTAAVPEPSSMVLMLAGLAGVAGFSRRRRVQ